jgi:hypothetical protein
MRTLLVTMLCLATFLAGGCAAQPLPAPGRGQPAPSARERDAVSPDAGGVASRPDGSAGEGEGFQKTRWGMGPADVQRLYPAARASRSAKSGLEVLEATFAGEPARIEFTFGTGVLSQVNVNLKSEGMEREQMLQRCFRFHELLTKKYGEPPNSELRWKSDREQSSTADALGTGQFAIGGEWVTPTTVVALKCERIGGAIVTRLEYSDKRLAQREDDAALEDL